MSTWAKLLVATIIALLLLSVVASCGLSPETQHAIDVVHEMQAQGRVTAEQAAALIAALEAKKTFPLEELLGNILFAAAAYFGVMLRRGPPERSERIAARQARAGA